MKSVLRYVSAFALLFAFSDADFAATSKELQALRAEI